MTLASTAVRKVLKRSIAGKKGERALDLSVLLRSGTKYMTRVGSSNSVSGNICKENEVCQRNNKTLFTVAKKCK